MSYVLVPRVSIESQNKTQLTSYKENLFNLFPGFIAAIFVTVSLFWRFIRGGQKHIQNFGRQIASFVESSFPNFRFPSGRNCFGRFSLWSNVFTRRSFWRRRFITLFLFSFNFFLGSLFLFFDFVCSGCSTFSSGFLLNFFLLFRFLFFLVWVCFVVRIVVWRFFYLSLFVRFAFFLRRFRWLRRFRSRRFCPCMLDERKRRNVGWWTWR